MNGTILIVRSNKIHFTTKQKCAHTHKQRAGKRRKAFTYKHTTYAHARMLARIFKSVRKRRRRTKVTIECNEKNKNKRRYRQRMTHTHTSFIRELCLNTYSKGERISLLCHTYACTICLYMPSNR